MKYKRCKKQGFPVYNGYKFFFFIVNKNGNRYQALHLQNKIDQRKKNNDQGSML